MASQTLQEKQKLYDDIFALQKVEKPWNIVTQKQLDSKKCLYGFFRQAIRCERGQNVSGFHMHDDGTQYTLQEEQDLVMQKALCDVDGELGKAVKCSVIWMIVCLVPLLGLNWVILYCDKSDDSLIERFEKLKMKGKFAILLSFAAVLVLISAVTATIVGKQTTKKFHKENERRMKYGYIKVMLLRGYTMEQIQEKGNFPICQSSIESLFTKLCIDEPGMRKVHDQNVKYNEEYQKQHQMCCELDELEFEHGLRVIVPQYQVVVQSSDMQKMQIVDLQNSYSDSVNYDGLNYSKLVQKEIYEPNYHPLTVEYVETQESVQQTEQTQKTEGATQQTEADADAVQKTEETQTTVTKTKTLHLIPKLPKLPVLNLDMEGKIATISSQVPVEPFPFQDDELFIDAADPKNRYHKIGSQHTGCLPNNHLSPGNIMQAGTAHSFRVLDQSRGYTLEETRNGNTVHKLSPKELEQIKMAKAYASMMNGGQAPIIIDVDADQIGADGTIKMTPALEAQLNAAKGQGKGQSLKQAPTNYGATRNCDSDGSMNSDYSSP